MGKQRTLRRWVQRGRKKTNKNYVGLGKKPKRQKHKVLQEGRFGQLSGRPKNFD